MPVAPLENKSTRFSIDLFSLGVLLSCLVFTDTALDSTLSTRFVFLSFFLAVFIFYTSFFLKKFNFYIDFFSIIYLGFVTFCVLSSLWSVNVSLAIIESSKIVLFFLVFILANYLLCHYKEFFLADLLKIILVIFLISVIQITLQLIDLPELSHTYLYNLTGSSGHKNLYSSFIFLCSVFSFIGLFYLETKWKYISAIAIVIQMALVVILQTRAVWLGFTGFFISTAILYFLKTKIKSITFKRTILFAASTLVILNIFFIYACPRFLSVYNKNKPGIYNSENVTDLATVSERVLIWEKTYDMINEYFWFGVGANNWQIEFPATSLPKIYPLQDLNVTFQRPHNDFLWNFSQYGIIGFNLFLIFTLSIIFMLYYRLINQYRIYYLILISGITGFLIISFFDFPGERIEHNVLYALLLGISIFYIKKDEVAIHFTQFKLPSFVSKIAFLPVVAILYFSLLNFKGEYFTKKMYVERLKKNDTNVISLCNSAMSFCYTVDPTTMPIYWYRGNANANLTNYSSALSDFKSALRLHPFNHYVLNDLGSAYFMNNSIDTAKLYYLESATINPRFDEPKLNLTAIFINEGNFKEAEKWNESIFHDSERRNYYRQLIKNKNK